MNEQIFPLSPGTAAPDFTLRHAAQGRISLRSLRGDIVTLVFYPLDWEPVSREQLRLYQEYLPEIGRLGATLLGISVDDTLNHEAFARHAKIRFPLLTDSYPKGAVSRRYGVYRETEELSARALFVIDGRGLIRFSQAFPDLLNPGLHDVLTILETMAAEEGTLRMLDFGHTH